MLILPIVNRNRVLNVELTLKTAAKIKTKAILDGVAESEVLMNDRRFSESVFNNTKEKAPVARFMRHHTTLRGKKAIVTTKLRGDEPSYDVYEVLTPPQRVNEPLDRLYSLAVTDIRKQLPDRKKGRYISFKQIGLDEVLSDEKLRVLSSIVSNVRDTKEWPRLFQENGIMDLVETLQFLDIFDCTVVDSASINENQLQDMLSSLEKVNSKDYRGLNKYYQMANDNKESFDRLAYVNKLIYNKPYRWIQSKAQKKEYQYVKTVQNRGE